MEKTGKKNLLIKLSSFPNAVFLSVINFLRCLCRRFDTSDTTFIGPTEKRCAVSAVHDVAKQKQTAETFITSRK
ncbi:unnamed protein product [Caenorhabditis auriculariae]|uniref:Uncharacterized protein n=1 Tax=Caenorhabditis auriculariae TaxID=2777116 RepID=A0A8S1HZC1_9PELO|nr:unnamed protein product [Caenorhabditis auriculariae]